MWREGITARLTYEKAAAGLHGAQSGIGAISARGERQESGRQRARSSPSNWKTRAATWKLRKNQSDLADAETALAAVGKSTLRQPAW